MVVRRLILSGLVSLCALVGVLVFSGAPALAGFSRHPFLGSFGPEGSLSTSAFAEVQGVAVDAEGDVYVYDRGAAGGSIYKFDSEGERVDFSALGTNPITGVGVGGNGESEIAVGLAGPTKGDIYFTYFGLGHVAVYEPDGDKSPGELNGNLVSEVPGASWEEPCGVAVDPAGDVYAGLYEHLVDRYMPKANPVVNKDYNGGLSGLTGICQIAVDSEGNVYAETEPAGPVRRYEASQFNTEGKIAEGAKVIDEQGTTLAADPVLSSHLLYVDERNGIAEYEVPPGGEPKRLGAFGVSEPGMFSGQSFGVAVSTAGVVYASNGGGLVNIYGATRPESPFVDEESVTNVTATTAILHTQVNPALADTHYYFRWGSVDCGEDSSACTDVPASPGTDIGTGENDVGGSSELRGLTPGTTYHYRVVAHNFVGTIGGTDATFTTQPAAAVSTLLDERAYELVSPPEKEGATLLRIGGVPGPTSGGVIQAEPEGNAITYVSNSAFSEPVSAPLASQYLATRSAGTWSSMNVTPPVRAGDYGEVGEGGPYRAFSSDLSNGLLRNPYGSVGPPFDIHAPADYENYTLHSGLKSAVPGSFQAALVGPIAEPASKFRVELQGANPDLTHIVLTTPTALTSEAIAGNEHAYNLYEWTPGQPASLQLINVLPGQTQGTPGAVLGADNIGSTSGTNAISDDGSRVFFTHEEDLYLRENGTATVQLDEAQGGPESGNGLFWTASNDGSRAFFTDRRGLTANAGDNGSDKGDLYIFETVGRKLTDIAPNGDVLGVLGASEDGSYVYFVANGVLAPGASPGRCNGGAVQRPTCNLYVWHNGTTAFIASLSGTDGSEGGSVEGIRADDWSPVLDNRTSRVASGGQYVVFMSDGNLTGYDSRNAETGQREQEVYVYDAVSRVLTCVSCNRTGARPQGPSGIPGATPFANQRALYQSRVISDENGLARVFFDSADPLVSQDTNGTQDVYEWEEGGRGGCRRAGGCVALISSGTSSEESSFLDASANGDDVFFLTQAKLVAQDTDNLLDIYDARAPHVPGEPVGSAVTVPLPPPCSNGDSCKPPVAAQPAIFGAPASSTFTGAGNSTTSSQLVTQPRSKSLIRAQKLSRALSACRKKRRGGRASCETRARRQYRVDSRLRRGKTAKGGK